MSARIEGVQTKKAVLALRQYKQKTSKGKKIDLLGNDDVIWLLLSLKKIPPASMRPKKIALPCGLFPVESSEICLITKDNKQAVKELIEQHNIVGISKIITVRKLKTDYKTFERKRQLCSAYDLFLTDSSVYHLLPGLLGKEFFARKKFPRPVKLTKKNPKKEIEQAINSTDVHLGLGQCTAVAVGRLNFDIEDVVSNIEAACKGLSSCIPGGWKRIQTVHMKTSNSIALPLYKSLPDNPNLITTTSHQVNRKRLSKDTTVDTALSSLSPSGTAEKESSTKKIKVAKRQVKPSSHKLASVRVKGSKIISKRNRKV